MSSALLLTGSLLFTSLIASTHAAADSTCFFPNRDVHALGIPCNPDASNSACCEATHTCLSNGLCFDTEFNHVIRGKSDLSPCASQPRGANIHLTILQEAARTVVGMIPPALNTVSPMIPLSQAQMVTSANAATIMSTGSAEWTLQIVPTPLRWRLDMWTI